MKSERTRETRGDDMRGTPGRGTGSRLLRALALAALLPVVLAGCGGGGTNGATSTSSAPVAPAPVLSASAALSNGLTATLAEDTATVAVGGGVTYTLTLTNRTGQPVTFVPLNDLSNPNARLVFGLGGSVSLVATAGDPFPAPPPGSGPITSIPGVGGGAITTLAPGQSVSGTCTGGPFAAPGKVAATASFATEGATGPMQQGSVGPLTVTVQ